MSAEYRVVDSETGPEWAGLQWEAWTVQMPRRMATEIVAALTAAARYKAALEEIRDSRKGLWALRHIAAAALRSQEPAP